MTHPIKSDVQLNALPRVNTDTEHVISAIRDISTPLQARALILQLSCERDVFAESLIQMSKATGINTMKNLFYGALYGVIIAMVFAMPIIMGWI